MKARLLLLLAVQASSAGASLSGGRPLFHLERERLGESPLTWIHNIGNYIPIETRAEKRELQLMTTLSISMSLQYESIDAPSISSISNPSDTPLVFPTDFPSAHPSLSYSSVFFPVSPPSQHPSLLRLPTVSPAPSATPLPHLPQPSLRPTIAGLYDCTTGGVGLVSGVPIDTITLINLSVGYAADVSAKNLTAGVLNGIEMALLEAAVAAALECNTTATNGRLLHERTRRLIASTDLLGSCNSTVAGGSCHILETELSFIINEDIGRQFAAYNSYNAMKSGMHDGSITESISEVEKLTYLAPLPLIPPANSSLSFQTESQFVPTTSGNSSKTKGWTIAAAIIMSAGGLAVLAAWVRAHRMRHKRHVELIEDERSQLYPVSMFSAEQGLFEDVDLS